MILAGPLFFSGPLSFIERLWSKLKWRTAWPCGLRGVSESQWMQSEFPLTASYLLLYPALLVYWGISPQNGPVLWFWPWNLFQVSYNKQSKESYTIQHLAQWLPQIDTMQLKGDICLVWGCVRRVHPALSGGGKWLSRARHSGSTSRAAINIERLHLRSWSSAARSDKRGLSPPIGRRFKRPPVTCKSGGENGKSAAESSSTLVGGLVRFESIRASSSGFPVRTGCLPLVCLSDGSVFPPRKPCAECDCCSDVFVHDSDVRANKRTLLSLTDSLWKYPFWIYSKTIIHWGLQVVLKKEVVYLTSKHICSTKSIIVQLGFNENTTR